MLSVGADKWKFGVDRKRMREWIQTESKYKVKLIQKIEAVLQRRRKIKDMDLEEMLLEWMILQRSKNLGVSKKLIQKKARIYAEEKAASKGQMNDFCASKEWLEKFMSRNGLSLCRPTTHAQKTPEQIIHKVISTTWIILLRWMKQLCVTK